MPSTILLFTPNNPSVRRPLGKRKPEAITNPSSSSAPVKKPRRPHHRRPVPPSDVRLNVAHEPLVLRPPPPRVEALEADVQKAEAKRKEEAAKALTTRVRCETVLTVAPHKLLWREPAQDQRRIAEVANPARLLAAGSKPSKKRADPGPVFRVCLAPDPETDAEYRRRTIDVPGDRLAFVNWIQGLEEVRWTWRRIRRMCAPGHKLPPEAPPTVRIGGAPFVFRVRALDAKGRGTFAAAPYAALGYDADAHAAYEARCAAWRVHEYD
jgi:hypothetical protein